MSLTSYPAIINKNNALVSYLMNMDILTDHTISLILCYACNFILTINFNLSERNSLLLLKGIPFLIKLGEGRDVCNKETGFEKVYTVDCSLALER